jgi:phosphotransferase system  glucose/maltose/N-acetylglucosamine-specific IIC component
MMKVIFVPLIVHILLNERNGFCRARLNRALKGFGMTRSTPIKTSTANAIGCTAYLIVPVVGSTSGVISTPFSTALEMSNTASDITADIQTEASARWRPVH